MHARQQSVIMPTPTHDDMDSLEGDTPECKDDVLDPGEFEDEHEDEPSGVIAKGQPPVYYSDDGDVYEDMYEVIDYDHQRMAWYKSRHIRCLVIISLLVGLAAGLAIVFTGSDNDTPPASSGVPLLEPPSGLGQELFHLGH